MGTTHVLVGNLTADPQITTTRAEVALLRFRIACDDVGYGPEGRVQRETVFHNVQAWRGLAQNLSEGLRRGDPVIVVGEFRAHSWETEAGERRTATYLHARSVGPDLARCRAQVLRAEPAEAPAAPTAAGATGEDEQDNVIAMWDRLP